MSIFLEQVEAITVSYGLWGRLFNFGNLQIESPDSWAAKLSRHPASWAKEMAHRKAIQMSV